MDKRLKVLNVLPYGDIGGSQKFVLSLCTYHDKRLFDVCLDLDAANINYPVVKNCLMINHDATTGDAVDIASGTKLALVDCRIASADPNAYPVADTTVAYCIGCHSCEPGKETVNYIGSATASSWAS